MFRRKQLKVPENTLKVLFFKTEKTDILNFKTVHSFNESSFRRESADTFNMVAKSGDPEYHKKTSKCQRWPRLMQLGNQPNALAISCRSKGIGRSTKKSSAPRWAMCVTYCPTRLTTQAAGLWHNEQTWEKFPTCGAPVLLRDHLPTRLLRPQARLPSSRWRACDALATLAKKRFGVEFILSIH